MIFGIRINLAWKLKLSENSKITNKNIENKKKKFEALTSDKIKQILELKKGFETIDKQERNKDKIIEILREEITLIGHMNQKVIEEKDRIIHELKALIKDKNEKIEQLTKLLKRETNLPFV